MPLRDYKCKKCGETTEHLVRQTRGTKSDSDVKRDEPIACYRCGSEEIEVSTEPHATGFRLEGTGWASDGYRSRG